MPITQLKAVSANPRRRLCLSLAVLALVGATGFIHATAAAQAVINQGAAASVKKKGVKEARQQSQAGELLLIDIRRPEEWKASGIPDVAIELDMTAPDFVPRLQTLLEQNPGKSIGLICATGVRSRLLADWMHQQGVKNVVNVSAGVLGRNGWLANRLPVRKPG